MRGIDYFAGRGSGVLAVLVIAGALGLPSARAQQDDVHDGQLVRRIDIRGLETLSEAYVRRVIKTQAGQPFARRQVEDDVRELLRARKFLAAFANTALEEGQVVVTFSVQEKPTLASVEIEGNRKFSSTDLYELTPVAGAVLDLYEVRRAREDILQKYKQAGYYYASVELDERLLESERRAVYRVTEGPRVKVRHILFENNRSYGRMRLMRLVDSKTYWWIFRTGALDEEQAERDALAVQQFYREAGFLDARVGYRLDFDPIKRADLDLVFVVEEGLRYRVHEIAIEGNAVFSTDRIRALMKLMPGNFLRDEVLREDVKRVQDLYGEIGYVGVRVDTRSDFLEEPGQVVLRYVLEEGSRSRVGRITVRGNVRTKDEVVRRALRLYPGEFYNTVEARKAEGRLRDTGLFKPEKIEITPLADVDGYREALISLEETETTQFLIGVGVSTDNGVMGSLSIDNRNFDLFDWPRSWGEFFRGRSLRGAGQRLLFSAEPGTEVSRFRISFTEPYLLDRPIRLDTSVYLFQRGREAYDEQRVGFTLGLSKRFEGGALDGWAIEGSSRFEGVTIDNVHDFAPSDIREADGDHFLTALRGAIVRDTTDSRVLPSEGYRATFYWEQVGALGGDYSFGKPGVSFAAYKTVQTDILERKSIVAFRADAAYIVNEAPVFERYYGGGFGSIRGFSFRGVTPRKGVFDHPVGGDFILLTGGEYSFPLYGKTFRGVTFVDMGTVEEDLDITSWRVSAGFGLRIQVDFFGPAPIVLDFGFPLMSDDDDETQVFNFAFGASF